MKVKIKPIKSEQKKLVKRTIKRSDQNLVLFVRDKKVYIQGREIDDKLRQVLLAEAHNFKKTALFRYLTETIEEEAKKHIFLNSRTSEDLAWGKAIIHTLQVQEKIMEALKTAPLQSPISSAQNMVYNVPR